jgi:hypothetical protein
MQFASMAVTQLLLLLAASGLAAVVPVSLYA